MEKLNFKVVCVATLILVLGFTIPSILQIATPGPETQITTDPSSQYSSAISENRIVRTDYRNGNGDIFMYASSAPELVVDPTSYDFGDIMVGETGITYISARNVGDMELYVTDIGILGDPDFEIIFGVLPVLLEPGDSYWVQINFTPTSEMQVSSILEFFWHTGLPGDPGGGGSGLCVDLHRRGEAERLQLRGYR